MKYIFLFLMIAVLSGCSKKYPYEDFSRNFLRENLEAFQKLNERLVRDKQYHEVCMRRNLGIRPAQEDALFDIGTDSRYVDLLPPHSCYISKENYLLIDPLTEGVCFDVSCKVAYLYARGEIDIPACKLESFKYFRGECLVLVEDGWGILYSVP